jgi:hypothetical protein
VNIAAGGGDPVAAGVVGVASAVCAEVVVRELRGWTVVEYLLEADTGGYFEIA